MSAEVAREVFSELPLENQLQAAVIMGRKAADSGADETIAWAKTIDAEPARLRVISEIVHHAGGDTAERLDGMIAQFSPGADRDAALRGAVSAIDGDAAQALKFASQISDADIREETFRRVVSRWLGRDESAARVWLAETNELSPAVKAMVTRMVAK